MGCLALAKIPIYVLAYDAMGSVIHGLARSDEGYVMFNLISHGFAMLVMLPTTFMAGMTLPILKHILLRSSQGEVALGYVYGANTIGSILGVLLAVHVLMGLLGTCSIIVVGTIVDIGLGLVFLRRAASTRLLAGSATASAVLLVGIGVGQTFDPKMLSSAFTGQVTRG